MNTDFHLKRNRFLAALLSVCALSSWAAAQRAVVKRPDAAAEIRRRTFEQVWRTVNEKYFDPTFGGVNWAQVHDAYAPRVALLKTDDALYPLLQQMLGELRQSHFGILPPPAPTPKPAPVVPPAEKATAATDVAPAKPESKPAAPLKDNPTPADNAPPPVPELPANIGAQLQVIGGQAVVVRVREDTPAARAGWRPGFVVTDINGLSLINYLEYLREYAARSRTAPGLARLRQNRALNELLEGRPETKITVAYLDEKDQPHTVNFVRVKPTGAPPLVFGNLPPVSLEFSAQRLAHNIGYLRFNIWLVPQLTKLRAALSEMRDAPGLIIDLRGNPGGVGFMANGLAGNLLARETSLGRMQLRTGYLNFPVYPQTPNYAGPLVILLDYGSASTSEIFAAALQESGRATVIGEPSAGAALPSLIEKLPNGALLQYAIADYQTPRGTLIEGRGVTPDVAATLTRAGLLDGHDAPLEAALAFLQTKKTP